MEDLRGNLKTGINGRALSRRITEPLLVVALSLLLACGSYSAGNMPTSTGTTVVNGTVSSVTLTSVANGSGGQQTATAVTLTAPLGMNSLVLCGDDRSSFTMNASVQVSYTSGLYCSNLVSVKPA